MNSKTWFIVKTYLRLQLGYSRLKISLPRWGSNLQYPEEKSDALSIRLRGQVYLTIPECLYFSQVFVSKVV